tara:strand:+ start:117 stop:260 length:144 start_codon:yes stop_codon:yes gene_type:complete
MIKWIKNLFSSEKKEEPKKTTKKKAPKKTKAKIQPTKKTRGRPRKKQ